jgi:hypothetical protein
MLSCSCFKNLTFEIFHKLMNLFQTYFVFGIEAKESKLWKASGNFFSIYFKINGKTNA